MDFIRVTLVEKLESGKKVADIRRIHGYLLPANGILSVSPDHSKGDNNYLISIVKYYKPEEEFVIGHAEAVLPTGYIKVIN